VNLKDSLIIRLPFKLKFFILYWPRTGLGKLFSENIFRVLMSEVISNVFPIISVTKHKTLNQKMH
jgi:hypothetical protein